MADDITTRYREARARVKETRERLLITRRQIADQTIDKVAGGRVVPARINFQLVRTLTGHSAKIYALSWAGDRIVTASQDGRLIVWNAMTGAKTHAIKLVCQWVMTCGLSPSGQFVASGGLDNVASIFNLKNKRADKDGHIPPSRMLAGHKGYISCARFVDDGSILTSSGDQTCILWDINRNTRVKTFGGPDDPSAHQQDVMSVCLQPRSADVFVSGSCDATAKLWDAREPGGAIRTFVGHTADINAVQFLSDGFTFGSGSDDGSCRLFDIRTGHQLITFADNNPALQHADYPMCVTSIAFSASGRILLAGYSNNLCYAWDAATGQIAANIKNHSGRVSCIGTSADGYAMATGSWDNNLRIFAPSHAPMPRAGA
ncbi:G protein beta subunit [Klebsormidium nitens]|uniref:G protein beta subunit n=1 Tax=Klebsormidium nitens TaxID=105231 RepID=A0A1Y1IMH6_KLENI|nr:G protein beta subunit [Klebsormidium nitens]|eukprot:GAQ91843.1 G protein beta subunit [Klebsormidium nitens]